MTLEAIPQDMGDSSPFWRRKVATTINKLIVGGGDNVGTVTIVAGSTETEFIDGRIGVSSKIVLVPENAAAAAMLATSYAAPKQAGCGTVTHESQSSDVEMGYAIVGS